jgi:hypothetical protein
MAITTVGLSSTFIRERGLECHPPGMYELSEMETLGYTERGDNPKESREIPRPRIGNPTNQALQWTYSEVHVENAGPVTPKVAICTGGAVAAGSPWQQEFRHYNSGSARYPLDNDEPPSWRNALLAKVGDLKMDLGTYLVEGKETVDLFVDTSHRLKEAYQCVAKRKTSSCRRFKKALFGDGSASKTTRKAAEVTLLANFGLLPLISDLGEAVQQLISRSSQPVYHRVVATTRAEGQRVQQWINQQSGSRSGAFMDWRWQWETSQRAVLWLQMQPGYSEDFSPGNPLSVLYEGIPFSFVLDWMIPVGDYLTALTALRGIDVVECTLTQKKRVTGADLSTNAGWTLQKPGRWKYADFRRDIIPGSSITPELPSLAPSTSWTSVVNATALLRVLHHDVR